MISGWMGKHLATAILLGTALVGAPACDEGGGGDGSSDGSSEKGGKVEKLDASAAKWTQSELSIGKATAKFFMTGRSDGDPMFMNAYFDRFPANTEFEMAGTKGTADQSGHLALDIDMKKKVGALSVRDVGNTDVDLDATLVIKAPGNDPIEQKLPKMRITSAVSAALAKVRDAPISFEGEPADDGKVGSVVMVEVGGSTDLKLIGAADKIWDLDWIAVSEKKDSGRVKKCGGYEKVKGEVDVEQVDTVTKIYERRTGKMVAEKTFQPKSECPSFAMVSANNKAKTYVHDSDIEPWVRAEFDKQK